MSITLTAVMSFEIRNSALATTVGSIGDWPGALSRRLCLGLGSGVMRDPRLRPYFLLCPLAGSLLRVNVGKSAIAQDTYTYAE